MQKQIFNSVAINIANYIVNELESSGFVFSKSEREDKIKNLTSIVNNNEHIINQPQQDDIIDSKEYNKTLDEIYMDLLTIFEQSNIINDLINKYKKINISMIANAQTKLATISDEILLLENKLKYNINYFSVTENFRSVDAFEPNKLLYVNSDNNLIDSSNMVFYDKYNECIKLPKLISINKIISENNQKIGSINISKELCISNDNDLDKIIDTNMDSYWSRTILSDTPISIELDSTKYYGLDFGAVFELEIVFNNTTEINEINLIPFSQFPLEVVAIKHYISDTPDIEEEKILNKYHNLDKIEILSPNKSGYLENKFIKNSTTFQFDSVVAKRIRILFNQIHYTKEYVNMKELPNDNNIKLNINPISKNLYDDKCIIDKDYIDFCNNINNNNGIIDINKLMAMDTTKTKVAKYKYKYGIANITVSENRYKDYGIYISKPYNFDRNIKGIILNVNQFTPFNGHRISYYISTVDAPKYEDWTLIRPKDYISIKNKCSSIRLKVEIISVNKANNGVSSILDNYSIQFDLE